MHQVERPLRVRRVEVNGTDAAGRIQAQEAVARLDGLADGVADDRHRAPLQLEKHRVIVDDEPPEGARLVRARGIQTGASSSRPSFTASRVSASEEGCSSSVVRKDAARLKRRERANEIRQRLGLDPLNDRLSLDVGRPATTSRTTGTGSPC